MTHADNPVQTHSLPLTARESLAEEIQPLFTVMEYAAAEVRHKPGWDDSHTVSNKDFLDVRFVQNFIREYGLARIYQGVEPDVAYDDASLLGAFLWHFLNFELHHRKTFWVDESLAWMLAETHLDIEGRALRLPFQSFAFVFTDRATLDVAEACLARDTICRLRGKELQILTVHVTATQDEASGAVALDMGFFFDDAQRTGWPFMLTRNLCVKPDDRLDAILDSRFPDVNVVDLDDVFLSAEMRKLVHLVLNAILFTTSCQEPWRILTSPVPRAEAKAKKGFGKGKKARAVKLRHERSREDVFYLPGKIPISQIRKLQESKRHDGGQIFARFMVRGHWRRPAVNWDDQRIRWIEPYWKGPEMAAILEQEYVLKK